MDQYTQELYMYMIYLPLIRDGSNPRVITKTGRVSGESVELRRLFFLAARASYKRFLTACQNQWIICIFILGLYLLFMPWLCSKEMIISKFNFLSQWYFRLQPKYRKTCHKQKLKSASLLSTSLGETAGTHFNNIFSLRPSLNSMFVCFWQSRSLLSRRLNNRPLEYLQCLKVRVLF